MVDYRHEPHPGKGVLGPMVSVIEHPKNPVSLEQWNRALDVLLDARVARKNYERAHGITKGSSGDPVWQKLMARETNFRADIEIFVAPFLAPAAGLKDGGA